MTSNSEDSVRFDIHGDVAVITIARPYRMNAVDRETAASLAAAFRRFDADSTLSVAVLTGHGGTFCAGADLKALAEGKGNRVEDDGDGPMGPTRMQLSKPSIAAIEGFAVAGGLELALLCDLRVAATNAVLGVACRRWGVPLIDGGTVRLPRLIGQSYALDMILTGRDVGAEAAARMGLVNRLADPGEALNVSLDLAREIAAHPQTCLRADRLSVYEQASLSFEQAIANELHLGRRALESPELVRGLEAFAGRTRRTD